MKKAERITIPHVQTAAWQKRVDWHIQDFRDSLRGVADEELLQEKLGLFGITSAIVDNIINIIDES